MTTASSAPSAPSATTVASPTAWTCPFCPLLCDSFHAAAPTSGAPLDLVGGQCHRASAALSRFGEEPTDASPSVDGKPCDLDTAVAAAARLLSVSHQPLFGGLGTDVAGARALYPLACATGAITDAAAGAALQHGLSAQQDRGGFATTFAEVRSRAELIVCLGGSQTPPVYPSYPLLFERFGIAESDPRVQRLGAAPGELFDALAVLAALLEGRPLTAAFDPALSTLAQALKASRYSVVVWDAAALPAHGALIVEAVNRIVGTLNRSTRAAAFPLGGGDGAATVNQTFTWLSGLPLRSRAGPLGLEHEPLRFDAARLVADGAVDALLWIASFGTEAPPLSTRLPTVVLGHPRMARPPGAVFIPVATPGIGSAAHLFRTDGVVLMPLAAVYADRLPTVADVLGRINRALST